MSLTFLYSLLIIMYVFFNQHLTSSMALNKENEEGNILTAVNESEPLPSIALSSENEEGDIVTATDQSEPRPPMAPNDENAEESVEDRIVSLPMMEPTEEINEGDILTPTNRSEPRPLTKRVLGKDNNYHVCPTNESLVDAEDILTFVDYIYDRQSYKKDIMSNYTEHAQQVATIHIKDVNKIEYLVNNPSNHLNVTLEELATLKNSTIDPVIEQIQDELREKPQLENDFKLRIMDLHMSVQMLKDYRMVCKHNCRRKLKYRVEKRVKRGQSFCVNLNDLYDNIESKLSVIVENIKRLSHSLINKYDKKLTKRENSLRRKLEKGFLGRSGKTTTQVYKLQNEHEKLSHDVVEISNGSLSIEIFGAEVDNKSIEIRHQVEDYGEYCISCDLDVLTQDAIETVLPGDYIVSDSIRVKYEHVWNAVQTHIRSFYIDLFAQLKRIKKVKSIKNEYRLTKEEEAELKKEAEMVLEHLRLIGPQPPTRRVIELVKKSKEIVQKLQVKLIKAYRL